MILLAFVGLCTYVSRRQTCKFEFHYKPGKLNDKFLKETKITQLKYVPYWCVLNGHFQGILYGFYKTFHDKLPMLKIKYDREVLVLKDGAEVAIEWYNGIPSGSGDKRPVLVCFSGLGSSTQATYIKNVIKEVHREYKCVYV